MKILQHANTWFEKAIAADPEFVNPHYYHSDFYLHYLSNTNEDSYRPDTLTYDAAYQSLKLDLGQAISKSKLDADKNYYLLLKTMYSDDWSGIRPIIERLFESPEVTRLLSFRALPVSDLLINLGYGEDLIPVCKEVLRKDPLNFRMHTDIVSSMRFAGRLETADDYLASHPGIDLHRIFALVDRGEFQKASLLAEEFGNNFAVQNPGTIAVLHARIGKRKEAEAIYEKATERDSWDVLWATKELYGGKQANREATRIDKKLVIDFPLLRTYMWFPRQLPFDLSATPNFARRLKQAGVITE